MDERSYDCPVLKRLTVRLPDHWRGQVTDAKLGSWLRSIPETLPPDPGGGTFRRSFALSAEAWERVQQHARKLPEDPSAWLRRLIAAKLGGRPALPPAIPVPRSPAIITRSPEPAAATVQPVPAVAPINRGQGAPYSEAQGKKDFQKYIAELEAIVRSGRPEAGEARVRLAQIRKDQDALKLVDAGPDSEEWNPLKV